MGSTRNGYCPKIQVRKGGSDQLCQRQRRKSTHWFDNMAVLVSGTGEASMPCEDKGPSEELQDRSGAEDIETLSTDNAALL